MVFNREPKAVYSLCIYLCNFLRGVFCVYLATSVASDPAGKADPVILFSR